MDATSAAVDWRPSAEHSRSHAVTTLWQLRVWSWGKALPMPAKTFSMGLRSSDLGGCFTALFRGVAERHCSCGCGGYPGWGKWIRIGEHNVPSPMVETSHTGFPRRHSQKIGRARHPSTPRSSCTAQRFLEVCVLQRNAKSHRNVVGRTKRFRIPYSSYGLFKKNEK